MYLKRGYRVQGTGCREEGAGYRAPSTELLGAPCWVAAGLKAEAALEEANGQHDDEREERAEDPAEEAFEDEGHRFSDGPERESGFARDITAA